MTIKELSKLYNLNREVEMTQKRLADLEWEIQRDEDRLRSLEAKYGSISSPSYDGMPKSPSYGNRIENEVAELLDLRDLITRKKALRSECAMTIHAQEILCLTERSRLERYIADLPDSLLRMIFTLRFISGFTWAQVSEHIGMHTTEDSVKKQCYRYLNEQNKAQK